ncbi:hypothetical protein L21SP5_00474 [Salinivirga cyanobacteriivorans]|uniref:Phosphate-selective porin n=1 Tax=Salinivirga cyanobacteriivorans TaxID=1307839 RepID=A0A0S2HVX2_9BACT|nr:hypothetical protein [Salinivirga cyanobacteriivorans]ALO14150.1 hypothetical protein L21SP5_00474 [Salinivirga cyanobacteriivorans]
MKKMNIVQFLGIFLILFTAFSSSAVAQEEENKDGFKFGGAVRYNIISESYESDPTTLNTYATWDTWRLNVDGTMKGLDMSFEYRFYPTFATHFMHHGWIGYNFNDVAYMKLGVSQVPFGITKFASHSWWFQGPYYVGLEDDYDMGIKFDLNFVENLDLAVAYYRQAEPEGPFYDGLSTFGNAGPGRYSYDITPSGNASVRELNNFNVRAAYHITEDIEIGASGQFGQNYNSVLDESEMSTAFAGHLVANFGNFNFKGEFVNYNYAAKLDDESDAKTLPMGAYGSIYQVATEANMYVAGLAYTIPVDLGPISSIQPYVDFTMFDKSNSDFEDSYHLIPGFLVSAGPIYAYFDFAMGKNQPWLTEDFGTGLGEGRLYELDATPGDDSDDYYYTTDDAVKAGTPVPLSDVEWNLRFNINVGYYF